MNSVFTRIAEAREIPGRLTLIRITAVCLAAVFLLISCNFPRVDYQSTAVFLAARQTMVAQEHMPTGLPTQDIPATPNVPGQAFQDPQPTPLPLETLAPVQPTPETICDLALIPGNQLYCTRSGDRLETVARRFRVANPYQIQGAEGFAIKTVLPVNTPLGVPSPTFYAPYDQVIFPDSEVLYGPDAAKSDIIAYAAHANGYLNSYGEYLYGGWYSGPEIIDLVARETSTNPRLLLSLTEFQSGWLFGWPEGAETNDSPLNYDADGVEGLYEELQVAARELSRGFYGWREGSINGLFYQDGKNNFIAPELNPGSVAVQNLFAGLYDSAEFYDALYSPNGFIALHNSLFGDPWQRSALMGTLMPPNLAQPEMTLPFLPGETWALTAGPHLTWQNGSPRGAVDLAPVDNQPGCIPSRMWATAAVPGLVVRSERGAVAIDLDGDGNEGTGWVLVYMHMLPEGRAPVGTWLDQDDPVGHPSCAGGTSTGTHLHIARKYNGEWLSVEAPFPFVMGGWQAVAGSGNYAGKLVNGERVVYVGSSAKSYTWISR